MTSSSTPASDVRLGEHGQRFLARFGGMIIEWNRCEKYARQVANCAAGETTQTFALTAGLGAASLVDMLRLLSKTLIAGDHRDHVEHVAEYLDRLRQHRNHLCHGFGGVIDPINPSDPENARGMIDVLQARNGKVTFEVEFIDERRLIEVTQWCELGHDYMRWVALAFDASGGPRRGSESLGSPVPKPPMPPLRTPSRIDWLAHR